jgi:hypothetical protein
MSKGEKRLWRHFKSSGRLFDDTQKQRYQDWLKLHGNKQRDKEHRRQMNKLPHQVCQKQEINEEQNTLDKFF